MLAHPFVIGELAMGSLPRHDFVLNSLRRLPTANFARDEEVMIAARILPRSSLWPERVSAATG